MLVGVFSIPCALDAAALSDIRAPAEVVRHHIEAMQKGDVAQLVADYADDAVVVFADTVLRGKPALRSMFAAGVGQHPPGASAIMTISKVAGDTVFEDYQHGGANNSVVRGTDIIVVRHGKIVFQATKSVSACAAKIASQPDQALAQSKRTVGHLAHGRIRLSS
jgi:hypothetical protein